MEHLPLGTVNSLPTIDPTVYTVYTIFKPRFPTETALMATCIPENCSWAPLFGAEGFSSQLQQVLPSFPKVYQGQGWSWERQEELQGKGRERYNARHQNGCGSSPIWKWRYSCQPSLGFAACYNAKSIVTFMAPASYKRYTFWDAVSKCTV